MKRYFTADIKTIINCAKPNMPDEIWNVIKSPWGAFMGIVLTGGVMYGVYHIAMGFIRFANGRRNGDAELYDSAKKEIGHGIISLIAVSAFSAIVIAILNGTGAFDSTSGNGQC